MGGISLSLFIILMVIKGKLILLLSAVKTSLNFLYKDKIFLKKCNVKNVTKYFVMLLLLIIAY